ncbi:MAG TPA: hypothetical protein VK427_04845, partial [Kofleriaceae bacterium]|nr:hypothetical protein [Kofleriaceae bacterium]
TATALIDAAVRARVHYLDVAAEQAVVRDVFARYRQAEIAVVPAMAFYGGLADLLASAAARDWPVLDEVDVAVALDRWHPTTGTRRTGERNTAPRVVIVDHALVPVTSHSRRWSFPEPFGVQEVTTVPLTEVVLIAQHLNVRTMQSYMNLAPLQDLRDPATPRPAAVDERGRSAQVFVVDVVVRRGDETRRATARGQDIYAITGPLVVEAALPLITRPSGAVGARAPGELFDARDFLASLSDLSIT